MRELLPHLPIAIAVARRGGFAAAAAELGMSPSAVSHAVRQIEERLGTPLFARTTRSVALTEAGEALMATVAPALDDIDEGIERIRSARGRPNGTLRINAPRVAIEIALLPVVREMARRYPEVVVELHADEALSDIVGEGFDAGVRLGEMIAEDMVAVRLTPPFKAMIVAAPAYVARCGEPAGIADLASHNCINYRLLKSRALYRWEFQDAGGNDVAVAVTGCVTVTDSLLARELAMAGIGIAYLMEPLVAADLAVGRLVRLLPDSAVEEPGLFLYFPKRASMAPKLRAFIDIAREVARGSAGFSRAPS